MKKILILFLLLSNLIASANTYYVSTTGSAVNTGAIDSPWTIQHAFDQAQAGDTVFFRGGTYYVTDDLIINPEASHGNSGTYEDPIVYINYPGEHPIIDGSNKSARSYNNGLEIFYAEHLKFIGIELKSMYQFRTELGWFATGIQVYYSRNLHFENMSINDISGRGVDINGGAWKTQVDDGITETPPYFEDEIDTTRFINCDFYNIRDTLSPDPGNGGDCIMQNHSRGNVVIFDGCRMWNYSDDGVDAHTGNGALVIFKDCWAMSSNLWEPYAIEGTGWKISAFVHPSGDTAVVCYIFVNCLAMYCHGYGFDNEIFVNYANYYSSTARFYNNTAYRNAAGFWQHDSEDETNNSRAIYRNNLAYDNDDYYGDPANFYSGYVENIGGESHNTQDRTGSGWIQWEDTDTVTVSDADFTTVDSLTLVGLFTASRQADGSLPINKPLQLAEGSDLIDAGIWYPAWDSVLTTLTDLGMLLDTVGSAPDIGYAEYGAPSEPSSANNILAFPEYTILKSSGNKILRHQGKITIIR